MRNTDWADLLLLPDDYTFDERIYIRYKKDLKWHVATYDYNEDFMLYRGETAQDSDDEMVEPIVQELDALNDNYTKLVEEHAALEVERKTIAAQLDDMVSVVSRYRLFVYNLRDRLGPDNVPDFQEYDVDDDDL